MSIYDKILTLLDEECVSNLVIFDIIRLLDEDVYNLGDDCLYNLLFEYLKSRDSLLLERIREICITRLENLA